jgi:transposase InsO family protein
MKKKSDVLDILKEYLAESERQTDHKLKILRTDGGGEYFSSEFIQFVKDAGILHEKTNPHTPQENSVAECMNRTLVTMSIAMLEGVKSLVGHTTWPYALHHSALIKNIIPHSALPDGISPHELWTGNKPSMSTIHTFGCKASVAIPKRQHTKLEGRSTTGIHLGLAIGKKAFLIYDPLT